MQCSEVHMPPLNEQEQRVFEAIGSGTRCVNGRTIQRLMPPHVDNHRHNADGTASSRPSAVAVAQLRPVWPGW